MMLVCVQYISNDIHRFLPYHPQTFLLNVMICNRLRNSYHHECQLLGYVHFLLPVTLLHYAVAHNPLICNPDPTTDPVSVQIPCHQPYTKPNGRFLMVESMGMISMPPSVSALGRPSLTVWST